MLTSVSESDKHLLRLGLEKLYREKYNRNQSETARNIGWNQSNLRRFLLERGSISDIRFFETVKVLEEQLGSEWKYPWRTPPSVEDAPPLAPSTPPPRQTKKPPTPTGERLERVLDAMELFGEKISKAAVGAARGALEEGIIDDLEPKQWKEFLNEMEEALAMVLDKYQAKEE